MLIFQDPTPMVGRVFVTDDNTASLAFVNRVLGRRGFEVSGATDGAAALAAIRRDPPDVVLLDVLMPGLDGYEVCRRLKADPVTRLIPVVLVTGLQDRDSRIAGLEAGADDFLTKPVDGHELVARVTSLVRLKRYTDALDSADAVMRSLALTIEARDPYTVGHCGRLAAYATELGRRLGYPHRDLVTLEYGAYLHDLGKIAIPDAILLKPGRLTDEEFEVMKSHPVVGDALCAEMHSLRPIRSIVRHHHERLDGSGYPAGLRGDEIPVAAQIMGIVDVYDALTTERSYKRARSPLEAFAELEAEVARGRMSRDLVATFVSIGAEGLTDLAARVAVARDAQESFAASAVSIVRRRGGGASVAACA
jgi:putative two-component system response regulator